MRASWKLHDASWDWAFESRIKLVAGNFEYDGHEFQKRPMTVRPLEKTIRKATQLGFTEVEVLTTLHGMIYGHYPRGVYYLFPTKEKVSDFSKSRFNPLIKENPEQIGSYVRDTDSSTLKRIGQAFLYFRSGRLHQDVGSRGDMKSSSALKGDPADHASLDEYDEMDQKVDEFIDGRLSKSEVGTKTYLANPTLPDYGTDAKFQKSSQEYWNVKCYACSWYTCLDDEEYWNEKTRECKVLKRRKDGTVYRACPHCGAVLDPRNGTWVAKRPQITDHLGFTLGQASCSWTNVKQMLDKWEDPFVDIANFIRLRLGRAYIEAENRLSIEQVYACCGNEGMLSSSKKSSFMGVDQGGGEGDLFHIVVGQKMPDSNKRGKIIHIGIEKGWEELDAYMRRFNVSRCVIDGLPNQEDARKFAKRWPGKVYLSYFSESQKGDYVWNEKDYTVSSYRTEAMDESHKEIANGWIVLPNRTEIVDKFAKHCHATAKKLEKDEQTGRQRYVYVPKLGGPDHFRLAQCYEVMARLGAPSMLFS